MKFDDINIQIIRKEDSERELDPTRGIFVLNHGDFIAYTLENPWRNNERSVSRIPNGKYRIQWRVSDKYGEHLHVKGVKDRSYILVHIGNTEKDTTGCILIGKERGYLDGDMAVLKSGPAMKDLRKYIRYCLGGSPSNHQDIGEITVRRYNERMSNRSFI